MSLAAGNIGNIDPKKNLNIVTQTRPADRSNPTQSIINITRPFNLTNSINHNI